MREVETANRTGGIHGAALCQFYPRIFLRLQELPESPLLRMVGAGGIPRGRPDAAVTLANQLFIRELFAFAIPPLLPNPFVQGLGEGFSQPVREGFGHDRI